MSTKNTQSDENQQLNSQQLLDESILCISQGMQLENDQQLQSALTIYEQGISLLTQAKQIETNNDVLPIISANLDSIQQRINSVRDKLQYDHDSMFTNLHSLQQQSINLLEEYKHLSQQHDSLNDQYDQLLHNVSNTEYNNINNSVNNENMDHLLSTLYQQYYGNKQDNEQAIEPKTVITEHKTVENTVIIKPKIDTIQWAKYDETSLIPTIPNDITGYIFIFISGRQLTVLFSISKLWCFALLYDAAFSHLWKRIIIGADPIRNSLGHNIQLKWLNRKICTTPIRSIMETLIISTAGLALDAFMKPCSIDQQLYVLRQKQFPKLRTLLLYGWSGLKLMSLKMVLKHNLYQLTALYLETPIDILDICGILPNLCVLQCNVINCNSLQLTESHTFDNMIYLSFVYGVDDFVLNRIFYCFPNLVHLGLEFDEIASSLSKLVQYKTNKLSVFHMSWNPVSFWGLNKNRGQSDVEYWLNDLQNVEMLVLDRDYVFDDDDKTENVEAMSALQQLLPHVKVTIAGGECTYNLTTFARFCGLE